MLLNMSTMLLNRSGQLMFEVIEHVLALKQTDP